MNHARFRRNPRDALARPRLGADSRARRVRRAAARGAGEYRARRDHCYYDAEDVVQTVFMQVLRIAGRFRPHRESARSWLFAITTRVLQVRARSLRGLGRAFSRLRAHTSRGALCRGDATYDLEGAIARLSPAKSTLLLLHEVEGFGGAEIACMLSIPIANVWTQLHKARHELRSYYRDG